MPRRLAPPPIKPPVVLPFSLGKRERDDVAKLLGLSTLSTQTAEAIEAVIANYKATANGSRDTTVANTLEALAELKQTGSKYRRPVVRLAHDCSGVDDETHHMLQPLANVVLAGEPDAIVTLGQVADARARQLYSLKRISTRTEPLRLFCGWLRVIFNNATDHLRGQITTEEAWRRCRTFAMEIFTLAEIDHRTFDAHPKRLMEYLGTDVSELS